MPFIFHVANRLHWEQAECDGSYEGDTLDLEGFIHCSTSTQLAGVLDRFFKGKTGLVLLEIDTERLTSPLKFEPATDLFELFPHIYGQLNIDAVVSVRPIESGSQGIPVSNAGTV